MFSTFGDLPPCILPDPPPQLPVARSLSAEQEQALRMPADWPIIDEIFERMTARLTEMLFGTTGISPADSLAMTATPMALPARAPLPAPRVLPAFPATALRAWDGFRW